LNHSPLYQFPATKFVCNSHWRQWRHLLSEVIEIGWALLFHNPQHAARETWDTRHSAETLHRILSGEGADIAAALEAVMKNNLDRGYYQ
jgi:hypothetical protein